MTEVNKNGLSRHIPADIRREVRRRCKFGCVLCGCGLYQYEHIDPTFNLAKEHDPNNICCLCASCHSAVTRGQHSKAHVRAAYEAIRVSPINRPPIGPLDFHDGTAELQIGGLSYSPAVRTVVRYLDTDIMTVAPGRDREPGRISAVFTDDAGEPTLRLDGNEWIGALTPWDIEIVGPTLTVRTREGRIALQLRLEPPGKVIIERLDMRFRRAHILVGPATYAVGRYVKDDIIWWAHVSMSILRSTPSGCVIEFTTTEELERRDREIVRSGAEMATKDRDTVASATLGIMFKSLGIAIGSMTGEFHVQNIATGIQSLEDMRRVLIDSPDELPRFIGDKRNYKPHE